MTHPVDALIQERDTLKSEVEWLRRDLHEERSRANDYSDVIDQLRRDKERLESNLTAADANRVSDNKFLLGETKRLREGLHKYGRHLSSCNGRAPDTWIDPPLPGVPCDCGLEELRAEPE